MYKLIVYLMVIFFSVSILGMDFGDGGMDFGDEVKTETKKKKKKVKRKRKKVKKRAKKKVKAEKKKVEEIVEDKKDDGMSFGDDSGSSESDGMSFGDDDSSAMTFDEEESNKINQDEMRFDFSDEDSKKIAKKTKKDVVIIKKKAETYILKGNYFKLSYGLLNLIGTPKVGGKKLDEKDLLGNNFILSYGYDVSDALSVELYGQLLMNSGVANGVEGIAYAKDVISTVAGLGVNFNFLKKGRLNLDLNLHGGAIFLDDENGKLAINGAFGGKLGMEYYLLLKHFSVLTSINGDYIMGLDTIAVALNASLKYSF